MPAKRAADEITAEYLNETVANVKPTSAQRKKAARTLDALANTDPGIEKTSENLKLVCALQELGMDRITPNKFSIYLQEVRFEETVERDVFLLKKEIRPHLDLEFKEQGLHKWIIPPGSIRMRLKVNLYWFIDKGLPGSQNTVGFGAFNHKIGVVISESGSEPVTPGARAAIVDSIPGELRGSDTTARPPQLEIESGGNDDGERAATLQSVAPLPSAAPPQGAADETQPQRARTLKAYISDSDMDDEAFTVYLLSKTEAAFKECDLNAAHRLFAHYMKWLRRKVTEGSKVSGLQTSIPKHMQDYYRYVMKSLLETDSLPYAKDFVQTINSSMEFAELLVLASAKGYALVAASDLLAVELVLTDILHEKQVIFFEDSAFFHGYRAARRRKAIDHVQQSSTLPAEERLGLVNRLLNDKRLEEADRQSLSFAKTILGPLPSKE